MADSLFLRRGDRLIELGVEAFESESILQRLIAENPYLLANPARTERIVLVDREMGVPDADGGADRWSIDHVFVDADAVPVIVEVKRASNTQVRREVVAQMLEYAANVGRYWPAGRLRTCFAARAEAMGESPEAALFGALGCEDADEFWDQVSANLAAGRMRLVFVADQIPLELLRIVEFLNAHMSPTEVVAMPNMMFTTGSDDRPRLRMTLYRYEPRPAHDFIINWQPMAAQLAHETLTTLAEELREIPGVATWLTDLEADGFQRYTSIPILGTLDAPGVSALFLAALQRFDERADAPEARLAA
jgi:hypothetical protein